MTHLLARLRFAFWNWLAVRLGYRYERLSTPFLEARIEAAHFAIINSVTRNWQICPDNGGSNLTLHCRRDAALKAATDQGAIRHVDDFGAFIVYTPRK